MFGTSFSLEGNSFENYYKDVSQRMKNRELDLLIVVNMFLTGFDSKTVNTLWVDKNLRMHGLMQAYSRTNRILNAVKPYGNIVCRLLLEKNQYIVIFLCLVVLVIIFAIYINHRIISKYRDLIIILFLFII
ncbi:hypothetical protein CRM88_13925, partial [Lactococcus lactis]